MKKHVFTIMIWLFPLAVAMAAEYDFTHRTDIVAEFAERIPTTKGYVDTYLVTDGPCYQRSQKVGLESINRGQAPHPVTGEMATVFYYGKDKLPDGGWQYVESWFGEAKEGDPRGHGCLRIIGVRHDTT